MKTILLLIIMLPQLLLAQELDSIKVIITNQDYKALEEYVQKPDYRSVNDGGGNASQYRIIENYYLDNFFNNESYNFQGALYDIVLITEGKLIIYAEISPFHTWDQSRCNSVFISPVFSFQDTTRYQNFQQEHLNTNKSNFDICLHYYARDLVHGKSCGIGINIPQGRRIMESLVTNYDATTIDIWLRSSVPLLQAYAIEGLFRLQKMGYYVNDEQKTIISNLQKSKAHVLCCGGCTHYIEELNTLISEYLLE